MPLPSPFQRLPGRVTFEWPATARRWRRDGWHPTPEAGWDLNGFVVCVCDAKQSTDSMIWQGYTKTKTVQQWLQMAKNPPKIDSLEGSDFSSKQRSADWHNIRFRSFLHAFHMKILSNCLTFRQFHEYFSLIFWRFFCTLAQWWDEVACRSLADHCYVWKAEMGLICFGKLILDRCVCSMSTTKLSWH